MTLSDEYRITIERIRERLILPNLLSSEREISYNSYNIDNEILINSLREESPIYSNREVINSRINEFYSSRRDIEQLISEIDLPSEYKKPKVIKKSSLVDPLALKREELSNKLGVHVPVDLNEDEVQKLLGNEVDALAARWFLTLRSRDKALQLPASMGDEFNSLVDQSVRTYIQANSNVSTRLPLDRLWEIKNLGLCGAPMARVIDLAEGILAPSNFKLGKVYQTVPITGLRAKVSPLEATTLLVYGLIGNKKANIEAAYQAFEKGKLEAARNGLKGSHLSKGRIFREISPYLSNLSQGDETAARHILDFFENSFKTEELSDLVQGVRGLFDQEAEFSHIDVKMKDGVYEDLFNNSRLRACTFLPNGLFKEASLVYHHDPDVGLLHVVPRNLDERLAPVGVSILLNATDENGRKWLVVDSVEGGSDLQRVKERLWVPAVYDGIAQVARDVGANNVLFNGRLYNGTPKLFTRYVSKKHDEASVNLRKSGMTDYAHLGISPKHSNEAFETWGVGKTSGLATGYAMEVK